MKGRNPTAEQKMFWDCLVQAVGCVACRKDGVGNDYVAIHHIDGRTKPKAHWQVLPLCALHHQDQGIPGAIPIHPFKARFEERYGRQMDLLSWCVELLTEQGYRMPQGLLAALPKEPACAA
jgi:hypothetical protein